MAILFPLAGAVTLLLEAGVLGTIYLVLQPESGSWLNALVGTVALASMVVMLVYSVARRVQALRNLLRLSGWLQFHIFCGLQGVLLAYIHCLPILWRHGWPMALNPGMLNLYAVTIVFFSGLFGRYLYAQVPKTLGGQHLEAKALETELAALDPVPEEVRALWTSAPKPRGFFGVIGAGFARRRALGKLRRMTLPGPLKVLAYRRVVLEYQRAAMTGAQRVFRLWIVLHRPLAVALYLVSFVHVAISLLFASGWGWW